ncbi:hypothetical protein A6P39_000475 [Streptomyces sp. FXJ1.172]|uniref:hypothetical protein n=1 Tax=Streptomyces sp. FXJ1.172 TaxID=710705 RepID=UPI00082CA1F6|nr:hypothetical protein [Streptomyces sp. FXJ1.172]WEO92723.1 hypothetical protein A6P39_000475 [Streptomyces sp. FXJ1.172]
MRQEWEPEDLIEVWTLLEEDQERLRNKSGANRLGFALLLKFTDVAIDRQYIDTHGASIVGFAFAWRSGRSGSPTPTGGPCPRCSGPM